MSKRLIITLTVAFISVLGAAGGASAVESTTTTTTTDSAQTKVQAARITEIKARGDQEINRRLASLDKLKAFIGSAGKLSSDEKATLTQYVASIRGDLVTLQAKLAAETTLDAVKSDAKSIVASYRVYAFVVPKVHILTLANDQQAVEVKLQSVATKLAQRIATLKTASTDVTSMETTLVDMNAKIASSQAITSGIITKIDPLLPTDYNSDHTILQGYNTQLKTAHQNTVEARKDAGTIVDALQKLESTSSDSTTKQ